MNGPSNSKRNSGFCLSLNRIFSNSIQKKCLRNLKITKWAKLTKKINYKKLHSGILAIILKDFIIFNKHKLLTNVLFFNILKNCCEVVKLWSC